MRNSPTYKKLKQIALDKGFTIEQVQDATIGQVEELVGHELTKNFCSSLKTCIIQDLREEEDKQILLAVKDKVRAFLEQYFPSYKIDRGREGNRPYITIWLKGRP